VSFEDPTARPYFLWSEPTTVGDFRTALAGATGEARAQLLGRLLREARDTDVWAFTTPAEVRAALPALERYLGRRRGFWTYLLSAWEAHGIA
jgi:hypothetical protein